MLLKIRYGRLFHMKSRPRIALRTQKNLCIYDEDPREGWANGSRSASLETLIYWPAIEFLRQPPISTRHI
jgi:hypothetical protein